MPLISYETSPIRGSDGQFEGEAITGCHIRAGADRADLLRALGVVSAQCQPCGAEFAARQLAVLRVRTKARAEADSTLTAAAYADPLANYPADVARDACETWARNETFWPAWAELCELCDRLAARRLVLRAALKAALERPSAPAIAAQPLATREERMRQTIATLRRLGNTMRAAGYERDLAAREKRQPEAWAAR